MIESTEDLMSGKNSIMKVNALVSGQLIDNPYLSVTLNSWICNRIDPSLGPLSVEGG